MSFVPKTSDSTLWMLLGTLVAALTGLAWRDRRDRARTIIDGPGLECDATGDLGLQDEGWQH
jgi:hypothetical protein